MPNCTAAVSSGKHGHYGRDAEFGQLVRRCGIVGRQVYREAGLDGSFDDILGYLKSTSVCSEKALGKDFAAFAAKLGAALAGCGEEMFHEDLKCGYTIGRKRT